MAVKCLVVTTEQPGQYGGAPSRNFNLIKQLAAAKEVQVRIVYLAQPIAARTHRALLKSVPGLSGRRVPLKQGSVWLTVQALCWRRVIPDFEIFRKSGLADKVLAEVKRHRPDYLQLEQLHAYYALIDIIPELQSQGIKIILDAHNVEVEAFRASISYYRLPRQLIGRWLLPKLLRLEKAAARAADIVLTCSPTDYQFFQKLKRPGGRVIDVPNGVDVDYFHPLPLAAAHSLIFTGGTKYPPNEDALRFYFDEIHPRVKRRVPDLKVYLLGGETKPWIKRQARHDTNVIIPGFVPEIRDYLAAARVCISPTRTGSGSSLKILEYLAAAKPTVTTRFGARGVQCSNNQDILISDSAVKFADHIIELMHNPTKCRAIGRQARRTAERFYSWDVIGERYVRALTKDFPI